jgi:hypothetical protein
MWEAVYDGGAPEEWTPTPELARYIRIDAQRMLLARRPSATSSRPYARPVPPCSGSMFEIAHGGSGQADDLVGLNDPAAAVSGFEGESREACETSSNAKALYRLAGDA